MNARRFFSVSFFASVALFVASTAHAATFSSACTTACSKVGGSVIIGSCGAGYTANSSVTNCVDTDVGSPTYKSPGTCCVPNDPNLCGVSGASAGTGASCMSITDCSAQYPGSGAYKYKMFTANCPDLDKPACCAVVPPPAGYTNTYDETNCTKLEGTCLPTSCGLDTSITQVGTCGMQGSVSYVCCAANTALTPSASTDASKAAAAGATASGTSATTPTSPPVEKPLITADPHGYQPPLGNATVNTIVGRIIQVVSSLVGALFLLMFLYGGFKWLTAGGDAKKVQGARDILLSAVIGIVIIIGAYIIVANFVSILGTSLAK